MHSEELGEKPEVRVLRVNFAKLCKGIQDPLPLAIQLYSKGIITDALLKHVQSANGTEKSLTLLTAVRDQVEIEPGKFSSFLSLLREEPQLSSLAHSMELQIRGT